MTFSNAPVMCRVINALDPALLFSEDQDDFYLIPESSCSKVASGMFLDDCSLGFASRLCTPSVSSQHHILSRPQLSYDGCEEPWFSTWIDDDARIQDHQACNLSKQVAVVNDALPPVDSPTCPISAVDGSPMGLSSSDSSTASPFWPWDDQEKYDCSVRTSALPLEPEQSTNPQTASTSTPLKKLKKKEKKKRARGPVQCPVCNIKFDKPCHLRAHMYDHGDLYKCEDCGQAFAEAHCLATHRKSHEWKPQPCPTCQKVFSKKSSYKAHLKLHDASRQRAKCPHWGCDKDYSQQAGLNRHLKIHDPEFAKPECDKCHMVFNRPDIRDRHRERACRQVRRQVTKRAQSARTPSAAQPAPPQAPQVEVSIQTQAPLPMVQQHVTGDIQQLSLPWEDPEQAWIGTVPVDATQLIHQPLSQDDVYQPESVPLDVQMAMQDPTMSSGFMEYLYFGQGFGQQGDMAAEMGMEL